MRLILALSLFSAVTLMGCSSYNGCCRGYRCANNQCGCACYRRCCNPGCRVCATQPSQVNAPRMAQQQRPAPQVVTRKALASRSAPVVRRVARRTDVRRTARFAPPPPPCIPEQTTLRAAFPEQDVLAKPAVVSRDCCTPVKTRCAPAPASDACCPGGCCSVPGMDACCPGGCCSVPGMDACCPGGNCGVPGINACCPGGNCGVPGINACCPPTTTRVYEPRPCSK